MQWLDEEQEITRQTVLRISREKLAPAARDLDRQMAFPRSELSVLSETGFLGCTAPRQYGGLESCAVARTVILEQIAQGCASTALVCLTHWVATRALSMSATETFRQKIMHQLAKGEALAAFAVHEAASGVIATAIETKAARNGEEYILDGSKIFTTSAGEADIYVVLARCERGSGFVLLGVDKDSPGLATGSIDERMGLRGVSSREVSFDQVHVPIENLLGQEGEGLPIVGKVVGEIALLGMAAIAVGISQDALDLSVEYAKGRTISGKPIGQTAAIKQKIAGMSVAVECMRSYLYETASSLDKGDLETGMLAAAKVKLLATDTVLRVTEDAIQVHGGHGYCCDLPLERLYRDGRGLSLHFKSSELLREEIGSKVLGI